MHRSKSSNPYQRPSPQSPPLQPWRPNCLATSKPIPLPPPVITATRPEMPPQTSGFPGSKPAWDFHPRYPRRKPWVIPGIFGFSPVVNGIFGFFGFSPSPQVWNSILPVAEIQTWYRWCRLKLDGDLSSDHLVRHAQTVQKLLRSLFRLRVL